MSTRVVSFCVNLITLCTNAYDDASRENCTNFMTCSVSMHPEKTPASIGGRNNNNNNSYTTFTKFHNEDEQIGDDKLQYLFTLRALAPPSI
jgi:hypothetical protein